MKRNNKKGFTIVELVIVIAVIAILAGVLIPTFSNVVEKANKSATLQEARNKYTEAYADDIQDGVIDNKINGTAMSVDGYSVTAGVASFTYASARGYTATFDGTEWTVDETT